MLPACVGCSTSDPARDCILVKTLTLLAAALSLSLSFARLVAADDEGVQFFEQKIRPMLVQHCYGCHSVAARDEKKLQGDLYLDSAAGVAKGGETGPILVKGKSAESLLLKALQYKDDKIEMPPAGKLPDEVIADFAKWIDLGAPDPRGGCARQAPTCERESSSRIGSQRIRKRREIVVESDNWAERVPPQPGSRTEFSKDRGYASERPRGSGQLHSGAGARSGWQRVGRHRRTRGATRNARWGLDAVHDERRSRR